MLQRWIPLLFVFACTEHSTPHDDSTSAGIAPPTPETKTDEATATATKAAPQRGLLRENLSAAGQAIVRDRMHRHIEDMNELLWSVLNLDMESVQELAKKLQQQPIVDSKPATASQHKLAPLAALSAELVRRAKDLEEAARGGESHRVASAFGRVTETCVQCHAAVSNKPETSDDPDREADSPRAH